MNIKRSIVGSLFSMLLVSEMAAADWGDVYYCQMTNFVDITLEGEKINYKLERFQFKLDQTKNAMVFGSTGYLKDSVYELVLSDFASTEFWLANSRFSITYFENGKLVYTGNNTLGAHVISAVCDKF